MYNNYYDYPIYSQSDYSSALKQNPSTYYSYNNPHDDRFFFGGALLAPFLLGGLAGAAVAPYFYRPYPYYPPYPPMYPYPRYY